MVRRWVVGEGVAVQVTPGGFSPCVGTRIPVVRSEEKIGIGVPGALCRQRLPIGLLSVDGTLRQRAFATSVGVHDVQLASRWRRGAGAKDDLAASGRPGW